MITHRVKGPYEAFIKRVLDIVVSAFVMILFSWLYIALAILVGVKLGRPVLFKQERPGKIDPKTGKEKLFRLYKFRSMTDKRDEKGHLLPDTQRLTTFGAKLRETSLDELPEMINIFRGDMSFVGPRPLAIVYLPYYTQAERARHLVRPGLTGLAQVNGRNSLTWEEKFAFDTEYVNNITFLTDLKIIFLTIKTVLKHEGISQGHNSPGSFHTYRQKQMRAEKIEPAGEVDGCDDN